MSSWSRLRSLFPVSGELVYLNHAGVAPPSIRVADAVERCVREVTWRGGFDAATTTDREIERVRERAARLIGARPDEIAFLRNTTEGLGLVAAGLDWRPGDRVVTCDLEYPSNVYPWWSLAPRGVETVVLPGRDGRLAFERVEEALRQPAVRLLALSSVEYASGFRHDLPRLGALCRERGVLFCVDAIQSLGALQVDVAAGIDFLAAGGSKWLCAVKGVGVFYCARHLLERLTPRAVGARSVQTPDDDPYRLALRGDAMRFEEGSPNALGIHALGAALDLWLELGPARVEERVLALSRHLAEGLARAGLRIESPHGPGEASGIVSFTVPGEPPDATVARLRAGRFAVAARRGAVRASPHCYNSEDELDALVAALR
jgi:selenocysteine lyase/cysteine desulfurase